MKMLSLEPDENMRWIYDPSHRDYNTEMAEDLRNRRAAALRSCPRWMIEEARLNDALRKHTPNVKLRGRPLLACPARMQG